MVRRRRGSITQSKLGFKARALTAAERLERGRGVSSIGTRLVVLERLLELAGDEVGREARVERHEVEGGDGLLALRRVKEHDRMVGVLGLGIRVRVLSRRARQNTGWSVASRTQQNTRVEQPHSELWALSFRRVVAP